MAFLLMKPMNLTPRGLMEAQTKRSWLTQPPLSLSHLLREEGLKFLPMAERAIDAELMRQPAEQMVLGDVPSCSLAHRLSHCLQRGYCLEETAIIRRKMAIIFANNISNIGFNQQIQLDGKTYMNNRQQYKIGQIMKKNIGCYHRVALLRIFLAFESYPQFPAIILQQLRPIEANLRVLGAIHPWRGLEVYLLDRVFEECLVPADEPIRLARPQQLHLEDSVYFDDGLIGGCIEVESNQFGCIADDEGRIDHAYDGFMRDPLLHRTHRHAIDILPVVDLMIGEVLVMDEGAFEGEEAGKDDSTFGEEEISGFDDAIEYAIEMQAVAHRFSQDYVYFCVELPPTQHLYHLLQVIFLYDFSHHVCALHLSVAIAVEDCVDLATAGLCCEDGVQAIHPIGDVEDCLAGKEMLVLHDGLVVGLMGDMVLHRCFEGVQGEVVDFAQMLGILQVQQGRPNFYQVFFGDLILHFLFLAGLGCRVFLHVSNQQLWRNVECKGRLQISINSG